MAKFEAWSLKDIKEAWTDETTGAIIRPAAPDITASKEELIPYLKRIAKTANMRIQRLEKQGYDTYATRKLYERLEDIDAVTEGYRVKVDEKMPVSKIRQEIKAVETFLGSAGSTKTGLAKAAENRPKGAADAFEISAEQAEAIVESMKQVSQKKALKGLSLSSIYSIGYDAKRKARDFDDFVAEIENHDIHIGSKGGLTQVDDELRDVLNTIWDDIQAN